MKGKLDHTIFYRTMNKNSSISSITRPDDQDIRAIVNWKNKNWPSNLFSK